MTGSVETEQYQAKWVEYQVGQLAALAQQQVFHIPRFQRDFVWNEGQIRLLADSVARNFPMGSLLLLADNPAALHLAGRPVAAIITAEDSGDEMIEMGAPPQKLHVLDGQQRLTSLARVFANISPKKMYYVDLLKVLQSFGPGGSEEADWLVSYPRRANPRKPVGRLVRADIVLKSEASLQHLDEFLDDVSDTDLPPDFQGANDSERRRKRREAKALVSRVFETIRNYRVPAIVIDRQSSLSAICRIFETINSTGSRLTTFDLAVASFFPNPDLRSLWDDTLKRFPRLEAYEIDGERILQLLALRLADQQSTQLEISRSAILRMTQHRAFVEANWHSAAKALDQALDWAEQQGARPRALPQEPILISIAAFFMTEGLDWLERSPGAFSALEKWYLSRLLQPGSKAATNYRIGRELDELLGWFRGGRNLQPERVRLTKAEVIKLAPSDVRYKAIFSFLVRRMGVDMRSQAQFDPQARIEDHHIYPRSFENRFQLNKRALDGIANRVPVTKETNKQISDRPPQEYLVEIATKLSRTRLEEVFEKACLGAPGSQHDIERRFAIAEFDTFLSTRAEALLVSLGQILNGHLDTSETLDESDSEHVPA